MLITMRDPVNNVTPACVANFTSRQHTHASEVNALKWDAEWGYMDWYLC